MIKFLKHLTRIALAIPLCLLSMKLVELNDVFQILLFGAIYVLVSLIIEPVFEKFEQRKQQNKNKHEH